MKCWLFTLALILSTSLATAAESWPQLSGDAQRSGNAAEATLPAKLGLVGAVATTDGIYTSPVIADSTLSSAATPSTAMYVTRPKMPAMRNSVPSAPDRRVETQ